MSNLIVKNKTVSTRVTTAIDEKAKENLAKQGITVSEYIRLALIKAANNDVNLISFLDSSEAIQAKKEAENDETTSFSSVNDFGNWVKKLNEN